MLPEFSTEPRELPWQPKLCKNKPKFRRYQFSKSYRVNVCVYDRVFGVGEFKYANKNFRGAKGVAIATKFTQKSRLCTDFSSVRNIVPISTYMIGFRGCRIQICYLNFLGNKERCYGNQICKNKPKLHKFHFCIKYWEIFRVNSRVSGVIKFTYTVCLKKNIPDIFSCNSRKHCRIFIIFGTRVTKKVSNQQML